jgi:hypothetical protein
MTGKVSIGRLAVSFAAIGVICTCVNAFWLYAAIGWGTKSEQVGAFCALALSTVFLVVGLSFRWMLAAHPTVIISVIQLGYVWVIVRLADSSTFHGLGSVRVIVGLLLLIGLHVHAKRAIRELRDERVHAAFSTPPPPPSQQPGRSDLDAIGPRIN